MPDLSFSVTIAVVDHPAFTFMMVVFGLFIVYYAVKFLLSLGTGG